MKKVVLGLSGGVDSSVALVLLLEQGYEVEAVFMRNWDSATNNDFKGNPHVEEEICEQERDYEDARKVCAQLGVKLYKVDFIEEYWNLVFSYFLEEYKKNRTPNPDVLCNNEIKFKCFITYAKSLGADYIATGHYAKVEKRNDNIVLLKASDLSKDQSYFLSQLESEQLQNILFPLGDITKKEVRNIARKNNLYNAEKKDSTGICFIGERNFREFLSNYLPAKKGLMKRLSGEVIKEHMGLMYYTIGQRKGLDIGGINGINKAWYVVGKDLESNTLFVEPDENCPYLYANKVILTNIIWRGEKKCDVKAKFRYRAADECVFLVWLENDKVEVHCKNPIRAVTPGQVCAFYDGDICLGAGFIESAYYFDELRRYC